MHANLRKGCPVFTSDGEELGQVKEVQGDYFKVDASMKPDYWLACSSVRTDTTSDVRVSFRKDQLDTYKRSEPASTLQ